MSGHSKWATTKRAKAVVDAKRGAHFTKLARAIAVAARDGGNPESNLKLRLAIDRARSFSMPKDNIDRAIAKGTGEGSGEIIESIVYEGFAPGGSAVVVEVLTDNRNRTAQEMKTLFQKHGGNLGGPGSVMWMFDRRGVIHATPTGDVDELALIELGVDDIQRHEADIVLLMKPEQLAAVTEALPKLGYTVHNSEFTLWPKTPTVFPDGESGERLGQFLSLLEDHDDVERVATSAVL